MRPEHKNFLTIIIVTIFVYFTFLLFYGQIFFDFLTEFVAGVLGILIGFSLDRYIALWKKVRISKQIINSLLVELNNNLDLVRKMKAEIKPERIGYFELFQTNAWDMFSSRLELDNIEILFDLGSVYHRFQLFNEGMKLESLGGELSSVLERTPDFFDRLEKDLKNIIERLNSLKI